MSKTILVNESYIKDIKNAVRKRVPNIVEPLTLEEVPNYILQIPYDSTMEPITPSVLGKYIAMDNVIFTQIANSIRQRGNSTESFAIKDMYLAIANIKYKESDSDSMIFAYETESNPDVKINVNTLINGIAGVYQEINITEEDNIEITTDGTTPWYWDTNNLYFRSGSIGNSATSRSIIHITVLDNAYYKFVMTASSESGYDKGYLAYNGTDYINGISGSETSSTTLSLNPGTHDIAVAYSKDGSTTSGSDMMSLKTYKFIKR